MCRSCYRNKAVSFVHSLTLMLAWTSRAFDDCATQPKHTTNVCGWGTVWDFQSLVGVHAAALCAYLWVQQPPGVGCRLMRVMLL
jgi:hypothetical protein